MVHAPSVETSTPVAPAPVPAELSSWLDAIAEITRAANRDAPLEDLLDLIAGATARLTGYDFCAVLTVDERREVVVIRGSYGLSQDYIDSINARTPIALRARDTGEGPSSRAFRSQRPTTVVDIAADPASRSWETVAAQQGYSSLLSVPLVVDSAHFGLINCYTAERHEFSAREIILMESMANQAGLAVETAQRLARTRQQTDAALGEVAALAAELAAQRRAEDEFRDLVRGVQRGGGLGSIARSLATLLCCTVVIEDESGHVLASEGAAQQPGGAPAVVPDACREAFVAVGEEPAPVTVLPGTDEGGTPACLVVPIVLEEEGAGLIWAVQPREPFGPRHQQAVVRAAAVAALALLRERTAQEVEWRLSRDFLDHLFDAEEQAEPALHARARRLGADLSQPHTVLVVRRDPTGAAPTRAGKEDRDAYVQRSLLSLVQRTAAADDAAALTGSRGDHVVVLWRDGGARSARDFAEHLRREIQAYASGCTATVGVGPSCRAVTEYGDAYRLICGALELVQECDRGGRVVSLDSIGAYRLLLQVKRPRELQSFAESMLGRVRDYDRRHQSKLGATLRGYMTNRCSVSVTAKALHVHPNTVAYRLRRVEEMLEVHLADPQTMLHLQLALMIEAVLGEQ